MDQVTPTVWAYDKGLEHNSSSVKMTIVILNKERTILLKPTYYISREDFVH